MNSKDLDWKDIVIKGGILACTVLSAFLGGMRNKRDLERAVQKEVTKQMSNMVTKE